MGRVLTPDALRSLLEERGFEIAEARSPAAAFGSWYLIVSTEPRLRILWEGKDRWLMLQRERADVREGTWTDLWIARTTDGQTPEAALQELLKHARPPR